MKGVLEPTANKWRSFILFPTATLGIFTLALKFLNLSPGRKNYKKRTTSTHTRTAPYK